MLTKFRCGHFGTMASKGAKAPGFIRWAETRGQKTENSKKNCPNCGNGREGD